MPKGRSIITDEKLTNIPIYKAYGEEVHMFLHVHLRGYDQNGDGKSMHAAYYDKYGAPAKLENSWMEGYHAVEKEIADHYNVCTNPYMPFPAPAASGGGAHLYEPIHHDKPWNWTGFVPCHSKWCCFDKFFPNRHFISLRGNEIQNNLWNYHPYDESPDSPDWDDHYKQLVPTDRYRGGYFFFNNAWGRYLHLISIKYVGESDVCKRYNYIVHPLAYRASVPTLPDDSVDAMQWSINYINSRTLNVVPKGQTTQTDNSFPAFGEDQLQKWGEKCNGLEIFNDFTYYYSSTPLDDGEDWKGGNGYLHDGRNPDYIHWFNSYPHEMGEFLLETSLRHGTYIQALAANDAMYQRDDIEVQHADPKASQTSSLKKDFARQSLHELKTKHKKTRLLKGNAEQREAVRTFLQKLPYQEDTVFGYTSLIDPEVKIRDIIYGTSIEEFKFPHLTEGESAIFDYLNEGRFYAHTGVYDIFNFKDTKGEIQQHCPVVIEHQDSRKFNYQYQPELHEMIFTLPKAKKPCQERPSDVKSIQDDIVWQFTVEVHKEATNSVECHRGYFKLSEEKRTKLDFTKTFDENEIAWIRIQGYDTKNPQRRAWFQAIKGPMFNKLNWTKEYSRDEPNPLLTNNVHEMEVSSTTSNGEDFITYKPVRHFTPQCATSTDLVFDFKTSCNEDYLCVYNLQVMAHKQNNNLETAHKKLPPAYLQNVCGVLQLSEIYPTKLDLNSSWDKGTVKDDKCFFYMVDEKAQLKSITEVFVNK